MSHTVSDGVIRQFVDELVDSHACAGINFLSHAIENLNKTILDIRSRADMEYLKTLSENEYLAPNVHSLNFFCCTGPDAWDCWMEKDPDNRIFSHISLITPERLEQWSNDNADWYSNAWQWHSEILNAAGFGYFDYLRKMTSASNGADCESDKASLTTYLATCAAKFPNLQQVKYSTKFSLGAAIDLWRKISDKSHLGLGASGTLAYEIWIASPVGY